MDKELDNLHKAWTAGAFKDVSAGSIIYTGDLYEIVSNEFIGEDSSGAWFEIIAKLPSGRVFSWSYCKTIDNEILLDSGLFFEEMIEEVTYKNAMQSNNEWLL